VALVVVVVRTEMYLAVPVFLVKVMPVVALQTPQIQAVAVAVEQAL
jgi:hypothetical protein